MLSTTRKLCGNEYLFKFGFLLALFLSGLNALSSSTPNTLGQRVAANSQPLTIFGRYRPHPNINTLVNHAECALLSYFSASEIVKALRAREGISNVRVQQRNLPEVAGTYSLIQYYEYDEKTCTDEIRRVIAIAGSRNVRNVQGNMDTAMEIDDLLGMKVHRGYKSVYEAVLIDFLREEQKRQRYFNLTIEAASSSNSSIATAALCDKMAWSLSKSVAITGHSLGGAVSCLLGCALQCQGYNIEQVTMFGSPKFTDKVGAKRVLKRFQLPVSRIEHVLDPAVMTPIVLPGESVGGGLVGTAVGTAFGRSRSMLFGSLVGYVLSDKYTDLDSSTLILLEPDKDTKPPEESETAGGVPVEITNNENDNNVNNNSNSTPGDSSGSGSSSNGILRTLGGSVLNPLTALRAFNYRSKNENEKPPKHTLYSGVAATKRARIFSRMADLPRVNWQWHSMYAYRDLLQEYQEQLAAPLRQQSIADRVDPESLEKEKEKEREGRSEGSRRPPAAIGAGGAAGALPDPAKSQSTMSASTSTSEKIKNENATGLKATSGSNSSSVSSADAAVTRATVRKPGLPLASKTTSSSSSTSTVTDSTSPRLPKP